MTTDLWRRLAAEEAERPLSNETRRSWASAAMLRRIKEVLPKAGVTRLAEITGLEPLGVHVCQAIRPNSRNLSISQGRGLTRAQAWVSAAMEALELFHAEAIGGPTVRATVGAMRHELAYDPYALALSRPSYLNDATPLEWVAATDLSSGAATWVPRALCELNACVAERLHVPLFRATSNGLAGGATLTGALLHGLCEVVERDALRRLPPGAVDPVRLVAAASVEARRPRQLLDRFAAGGFRTRIVDAAGPVGLPCFEVTLAAPDRVAPCAGSACHPRRATALLSALTEAAATRLTCLAGSRDDLFRPDYAAAPPDPAACPTQAEGTRRFRGAPSLRARGPAEALRAIVARVRAVTGMAPLAVDLTRPDFGLPVVFVVAPGLEVAAS